MGQGPAGPSAPRAVPPPPATAPVGAHEVQLEIQEGVRRFSSLLPPGLGDGLERPSPFDMYEDAEDGLNA